MAKERGAKTIPELDEALDFENIVVDDGTPIGKRMTKASLKALLTIEGTELEPLVGGTTSGTALVVPNGPAGEQRTAEVSSGKWYDFGSGPVEASAGRRWKSYWNGTSWFLKDMGELPTVDVLNDYGSSTTEAISQAKTTELRDRVDNIVSTSSVTEDFSVVSDADIVIGFVGSTGTQNNTDATWRKVSAPVESGVKFKLGATNFVPSGSKNACFYNISGTFISRIAIDTVAKMEFTPPSGAVRVTINLKEPTDAVIPSNISLKRVITADTKVDTKDLFGVISGDARNNARVREIIEANSDVSTNLLKEVYVNGNVSGTGVLNNDAAFKRTEKQPIKEGAHVFSAEGYTANGKNIAFFNDAGTFLGRYQITTNPFPFSAPVGTVSYAMTMANTGESVPTQAQINKGFKVLPYKAYTGNMITSLFGYTFPTAEQQGSKTYAQLKSDMASNSLAVGTSYLITNGPGGYSFRATASTSSSINENIDIVGLDYDYYKIDIANDMLIAFDNIACIIRNTSGSWAFITTSGHKPKGFASIDNSNANRVTINYSKTYNQIGSLPISMDETYTAQGITAGPSVGLSSAILEFSMQGLSGSVAESGGTFVIDNSGGWKNPLKTAVFSAGQITVTHSAIVNSYPIIQSINPNHRPVIISQNTTQVVFRMVDATGADVTNITGISFSLVRLGTRKLTNSEMALSGSNIWIQGLMMTEIV